MIGRACTKACSFLVQSEEKWQIDNNLMNLLHRGDGWVLINALIDGWWVVACCLQEVTVAAAGALIPAASPLPQAPELLAEDKVKELQQQVSGLREQLALKDQQLEMQHDHNRAEGEAQRRQLVAEHAKRDRVNTAFAQIIHSLHKVCGAEHSSYATSRFWSP